MNLRAMLNIPKDHAAVLEESTRVLGEVIDQRDIYFKQNQELRAQLATAQEKLTSQKAYYEQVFADGAKQIQKYKQDAERWREFAEHQEICADCAESVAGCDVGIRLRNAARGESEDGYCYSNLGQVFGCKHTRS